MALGGERVAVRERVHATPDVGFRWLRLLGAVIVIVNHSAPLTDPVRTTIFPAEWHLSPGHFTLMAFFAMSGYQVSGSWARDPSWWRFAARRLLRVMPPLLLVLMVTAFVIGPLFTTLTAGDYWGHSRTTRYVVFNAALFPMQHDLPGVFTGNPWPWGVNGSIWTLPMEVLGYGIILVVGLVTALGAGRFVLLPVLAALVALDSVFLADDTSHGRPGAIGQVPIGPTASFLVAFVVGMIIYTYRDRIPLSPRVAGALAGLWLAVHWTPADRYVLPVAAGYGVIVLAHHLPKRLENGKRWAYGSYGTYLWGFVIQQMIVHAGVTDEWVLAALAVPVAYVAGVLSWRYVEEPTQQLRSFIRKRAEPVPERDAVVARM